MPAPKKLLPRPCPQCGLENGGMQWVIFNPRFSNSRRYNKFPYSILRISHYCNELSSMKKKKVWHNFRIYLPAIIKDSKKIILEEIFKHPYFWRKKSITLQVTKEWFEYFQKYGWIDLKTERAHFINKGDLKKCIECQNYFKKLNRLEYPKGYSYYPYSWFCDICYPIVKLKIVEWEQNKRKYRSKNSKYS